MNISMVVGAGFSHNAGLPMVNRISELFLKTPLVDFILNFQSSEWRWKEFASNADKINGCLGTHHYNCSFFLEHLIKNYKKSTGSKEINYEEFYQWIYDLQNLEKWHEIKNETKVTLKNIYNGLGDKFEFFPDQEVFSCILHLIEDLITIRKEYKDYENKYSTYLKLIKNHRNTVNIFTLNHDQLFDKLLLNSDIKYSNGFSIEKSELKGYNGEVMPIFNNNFNERVNILKLHGSMDQYKYLYQNGGYDYFLTNDFHSKHFTKHINIEGKTLQNFNMNITPQFITGQNKLDLIRNDKMYHKLYEYFERELPKTDKLIIAGYSYKDNHINTVLKNSKDSIKEIINVNPNDKFLFKHKNLREINPLEEALVF